MFESYPKRTNELGEELHRLSGRAPEIGADKGGIINDLIDEFEAYARRTRVKRLNSTSGGKVIGNFSQGAREASARNFSPLPLLSKEFQLHLLLISRRLVVIRAVSEKNHGPRLSVAQIDRIYSAISRGGASHSGMRAHNHKFQMEKDLFMDWLAKSILNTKIGSCSVLSQSDIRTVFMERLCSSDESVGGLLAHPEQMTHAAWKCFHALFLYCE